METHVKSLLKFTVALLAIAVVFLLLFQLGVFYASNNRPGMPNNSKENPIVIKDSVETKKLHVLYDSVVKENKRLDAIINRKQSHTSQILKQNEINKKRALSVDDSTAIHILDSLIGSDGRLHIPPCPNCRFDIAVPIEPGVIYN
jgi:hypothetical protein